jgi:flagellar export protein FliJ
VKRFTFPLEAVFELRKRAQDLSAQALASVAAERAVAERACRALGASIDGLRLAHGDRRRAGALAGEEKAVRQTLVYEEEKLAQREAELGERVEREAAARERLARDRLEVKRLERLKERGRERFLLEREKREERELQEAAAAGFILESIAGASGRPARLGRGHPVE